MHLDPIALLFTNLVVGVAVIGILLLSQARFSTHRSSVYLWVAGDVGFLIGRLALLLQPGALTAAGLSPLTPLVAFVGNSSMVLVGVLLHAFSLIRLSGALVPLPRVGLVALGIPLVYAAVSLLLGDAQQRLQLMMFCIVMGALWTSFYAGMLRSDSTSGGYLILASLAVVIVIDTMVLLRLLLRLDVLPALAPGAPDIPPLPALIVDLIVPLLITMGYVLLLQERLMAHIGRLSTTDPLTGALNRRGLMSELEIEWPRMRRYGGQVAAVLFDLDHFKRVNDTYGHRAGDEVLCGFVVQARAQVRPMDRLARWGGEEFLLMLPNTDAAGAMVVAQRIRQAVEATPMTVSRIAVTVSAGVAASQPDQPEMTLEQLLEQADRCLYQAKATRNCVVTEAATASATASSGARPAPTQDLNPTDPAAGP